MFGNTGFGPTMFGTFQTLDGTFGRLDEFVDGRNLTAMDVEDASIRSDIAHALATFHSLKLQQEEKLVEDYYTVVTHNMERRLQLDKFKSFGSKLNTLLEADLAGQIRQVTAKMAAFGAKHGWCLHDMQYPNILVKTNPTQSESAVSLIDFEFTMQNYRGVDIGKHFLNKVFWRPAGESGYGWCRPFSLKEKTHFCHEYARQWNIITGDTDTGEKVLLEAEYGYLLAIAFHTHGLVVCLEGEEWSNKEILEL